MRKLCRSLGRLILFCLCALGAFAFATACGGASTSSAPPRPQPATSAAPAGDHARPDRDHKDHKDHKDPAAAHADHRPGHQHGHHPDHHPGPASMAGHPAAADHTGHPHHDGHHANHAGGMQHDFKGAEGWAKVFDDPARAEWQRPDEVAALLQVKPGMTVADVGAGTGYFVSRLAAAAGDKGQVIATDLEPDMVRYLEERARREGWKNVRAVQVPADDPGLAKTSVDRVLVVDVWHHLGDRRAYAAKLAAALRPGGRIAIVDFDVDARRGPPAKHRLAAAAIMDDLRAAGLVAELATESLPDQYVVIGTKTAR